MTAEQLEELQSDIIESGREYWPIASEDITAIIRRVIAAEKLVEALNDVSLCDLEGRDMVKIIDAVDAYREASK